MKRIIIGAIAVAVVVWVLHNPVHAQDSISHGVESALHAAGDFVTVAASGIVDGLTHFIDSLPGSFQGHA